MDMYVRVIIELSHDLAKFLITEAVRMNVNVIPTLLLAKIEAQTFRT